MVTRQYLRGHLLCQVHDAVKFFGAQGYSIANSEYPVKHVRVIVKTQVSFILSKVSDTAQSWKLRRGWYLLVLPCAVSHREVNFFDIIILWSCVILSP